MSLFIRVLPIVFASLVTAPALAQGTETPAFELTGAPGAGVTARFGDAFSLNVRSRIQLRYQLQLSPEDAQGDRDANQLVNVGTARLWFSGNMFDPSLTYMIQLAVAGRDFRDGATSPIFDAFIDWKLHRDFNVRVGQYFVPFDRLRTVREFALQMPDRPRPIGELTLDRDVGVTVYSEHFLDDASPLGFRVSAFGGGGTNLSLGREPGALLVARLELRPLGPIDDDSEGDLDRRPTPGLAIGVAGAANINTNRVRSTTGATYAGGTADYVHAAADLVFKWYGLALQAEYLYRAAAEDTIESLDDEGAARTEHTRSGHGLVLQASYVFDPPVEIVARYSRLWALDGTDPAFVAEVEGRGQELALGLNYYFNSHRLKAQLGWTARTPSAFDMARAEHLGVVQIDATF